MYLNNLAFQKEIPKIQTTTTRLIWMEPRVQYLKVPKTTKIPKIPFYNVSEQFTF